MLAAPPTPDEDRRLRILQLTGLLDSPAEEAFDRLTRLAAELLEVPIALVVLIDRQRQWFKSRIGLDVAELPRETSFCGHALHAPHSLVVPDARSDPRFADNPLVTGEPHIRFYAGVPLRSTEGVVLGTLCVIDRRPRELSASQLRLLVDLGDTVSREILHRESAALARELSADHLRLVTENAALTQAAFDQAGVGIAMVGLDRRWIRFNPKLPAILGYSPAELARRSDLEITHPDDIGIDLLHVQRLLEGAESQFTLEKRYIRRDGSPLWVNLSVTLVRDSAGQPQYFISVVKDIDARKQAEAALRESEERFRALDASSPVGIFQSDTAGRLTHVNPRGQAIWGMTQAEMLGSGWTARVHPDDLPELLRGWKAAFDAQREHEADYRLRLPDGTTRHVHGRAALLRDAAGTVIGSVGTVTDVTERWQMSRALTESERSLRLALDAGRMVAWELDLRRAHPPGATERTERRAVPAGGDPATPALRPLASYADFLASVHPEDRARVEGAGARTCAGEADFVEEFRVVRPGGEVCWQHVMGRMVRSADGEPERLVGVSLDITERKALEAELMRQAYQDTLTGLANRARLRERVAQALACGSRPGTPDRHAAVLFVDLDEFKTVNDSLGHEVGDRLLVLVAGRLLEATRGSDTVARLGGDEFAILLDGLCGADEAARVADRIVASLATPFLLERREIRVGASIGIALARPQDTTDDLLRNADLAMYRAKNGGKGRHETFVPEMHALALARLTLESDLHRALDAGEFVLQYQPIVELATARIVGAEALVRWRHPVQGMVAPGRFIPLAEETGLILPLGRRVLAEACREARDWPSSAGGIPALTVNVSARQLQHPGFTGDVSDALRASALAPGRLVLEITESVLMRDREAMLGRLRELKALGVQIAVDDFGTGFSSLAYLQQFPIDILKIDKAFVDPITRGDRDAALVRTIVGLADALGLRTVAEGVEEAGQDAELRGLGCRYGQGYLFSRPLAPEALRLLLGGALEPAARAGSQAHAD